ncbi:Dihydroorotate dehydrogenase [Bifidobacterium goeldii]|uniref:Dihydroorotate dehydrogenase (quinone) n=2 Tax=Bifidobacterium goeldii TaxID=2306975 RepID=A0A430FKK9_9BIFI|nr:Dihydroorotate dehydrogenase [Bifidobacterium goeldii]
MLPVTLHVTLRVTRTSRASCCFSPVGATMEPMTYVSENFWHDAVNKATTDLFAFGYKHVIKPNFVFNHNPDTAHDQMIEFCRITKRIPPLMWLLREMIDYTDPVLETNVMGVDFANPFGLSAGLDKNCDMPVLLDNAGFGFETVGSTTARPCPGNPKPWFHRLPEYDSMMVHVGLANDGSEKVIARAEQAWTRAKSMQISVSIARTNDAFCGDLDEGIEDYCTSMRRAAGRSAMVEVNVSCPNTHVGEPFTADPNALDRLFDALDQIERPQPTLVKMPLNTPWPQFKELLDVLAEHNVQGVSIANLQKDRTGLEIPRDWEGGLSGGPCYAASNERIAQVYREYGDRFAIAGIGGVFTPQQAYQKIRNGSSLVMFISSLMYRGPQQITVLKRGLAQLLKRDGFEHVADAVGVDA